MQKPPKQKQATRGQRQIYEENRSTFFTYLCASLASTILVTALDIFAFKTTNADWFGLIISAIFEFTAVTFMFIMSKNVRNEKNQVVDAGLDLNDPEAFGEYCKDIVILSVIVQLLGLISSYFYLILLIVPGYAAFKLWTKLLAPWFFAPAPEVDGDESNKRKQKKKEKTVYLRR